MLPEKTPANIMQEIWDRGEDLHAWAEGGTPPEMMLWKAGYPRQVKDVIAISHLTGVPARVIGSHKSKSIDLPVSMYRADIYGEETIYFVMRDNFHDLKLVVVSTMPINIPYEDVYQMFSPEAYAAEKKRAYDYQERSSNFNAAEYETDAWYPKWGGRSILRTDDNRIFSCANVNTCYYEGMTNAGVPHEVFHRYEQGRSSFATEVWKGVVGIMSLMKSVVHESQDVVMARRHAQHEAERAARKAESVQK